MKRTRFTDEQIVGILQAAVGAGTVREVCRRHGITETKFYRWRTKYGGMQKAEIRRLKQLQDENRRLKKLVADLARCGDAQRRGGTKLVTTRQRRGAVTHLRTAYPVSDRRACRLVQLARSRWQYHPHRPDDGPPAAALAVKAAARPRWGYRRLALLLTRDGWAVNHSASRGSTARRDCAFGRAAAQAGEHATGPPAGRGGGNAQWMLDFITDAFTSGASSAC